MFDHRPPRIARAEPALVEPDIESGVAERALQTFDRFHILARVADENSRRLVGGEGSVDFSRGRFFRERLPLLRELIHELDRVRNSERLGLRAEVLQEIAQMDIRHHRAVRDEFARLVSAVKSVPPA